MKSLARRTGPWSGPEAVEAAMAAAGIDPSVRPERVTPGQFIAFANSLSPAVQ